MPNRGELTHEIELISERQFGEKFTKTQLRFLPYLLYVLVNKQVIEREKINGEERKILSKWIDAGRIYYDEDNYLQCTLDFWQKANNILYLGYVNHKHRGVAPCTN